MTNQQPLPGPIVESGRSSAVPYGVTLPNLDGGPPNQFEVLYKDTVLGMLAARAAAHRVLRRDDSSRKQQRGEFDPRMVALTLGSPEGPFALFLVDEPLFTTARQAANERYSALTSNALAKIAIANTVNAVRPEFTPDAINDVNASYFRSPFAFAPESGLAHMFTSSLTLNMLLGAHVTTESGKENGVLRVKELCTGNQTAHWEIRARAAVVLGFAKVEVVATDLAPPEVSPDSISPTLSITSEAYSLFDDMPELPPDQRFDVMMTSYGFDSVWHPADIRLTRVGDQWYQSLYRVKVADWNSRKAELLGALSRGDPLSNARPTDYEGIFVEEVMQEVDISGHPWEEELHSQPDGIMNIPGGLIIRAAQAFERQLTPDGIFVSVDTADLQPLSVASPVSGVSGVAERYKIEDYAFAKKVLERRYGLQVDFATLGELVDGYLPDEWESLAEPYEIAGIHADAVVVMTVRRAPASKAT